MKFLIWFLLKETTVTYACLTNLSKILATSIHWSNEVPINLVFIPMGLILDLGPYRDDSICITYKWLQQVNL